MVKTNELFGLLVHLVFEATEFITKTVVLETELAEHFSVDGILFLGRAHKLRVRLSMARGLWVPRDLLGLFLGTRLEDSPKTCDGVSLLLGHNTCLTSRSCGQGDVRCWLQTGREGTGTWTDDETGVRGRRDAGCTRLRRGAF